MEKTVWVGLIEEFYIISVNIFIKTLAHLDEKKKEKKKKKVHMRRRTKREKIKKENDSAKFHFICGYK